MPNAVPMDYQCTLKKPDDFDAFWDGVLQQVAAIPLYHPLYGIFDALSASNPCWTSRSKRGRVSRHGDHQWHGEA